MFGNGHDNGLTVEQAAVGANFLWGPFTHNHNPMPTPAYHGWRAQSPLRLFPSITPILLGARLGLLPLITNLSASDATVNLFALVLACYYGGPATASPVMVHHTCPHVPLWGPPLFTYL